MSEVKIKCPECDGTGEMQSGEEILDCPVCDGTGKIDDQQ